MRLAILTLLCLAGLAVDAVACPRPFVVHKAAVVKQDVVVVPVYYPTYSISYQQPPAPAPQAESETIRVLLAEVQALRKEMADLRGREPQAPAAPLTFEAVVLARCAKCHTEGGSDTANGFNLVAKDGKVIDVFSVVERRRIAQMLATDRMPKNNPPLSAVEKKAVANFLEK